MSMIDKMSILGIRSFGVRDDERQVIEFEHPLTLIVGENGAGKTTIIECLKYVTTGDQPGNTKGGAFIHDAKLVGESEVRAQVGLKFSDIQGTICTVKRSLQFIQKADKGTVRTLDGVITKQKECETVSVTSKCCDINAEMVSMLGVSKAVLENVIFCHQEDSSWPLAEGKTVKQKFDDIFAATRYIKALESIKQTRKLKDAENKTEKTKLDFLKNYRDTALEKRTSLEEHETKLKLVIENVSKIKTELKPLEEQLHEVDKSREEIMAADRKLGEAKSRHKQMKDDRDRLVERIQNLFHGTDAQLEKIWRDQEKDLDGKRTKLESCQGRIDPIQREVTALSNRKNGLILKQGKLQQEFESFQERVKGRNNLLVRYSEEYGVCSGRFSSSCEVTQIDSEEFVKEMMWKIENKEEILNSKKVGRFCMSIVPDLMII